MGYGEEKRRPTDERGLAQGEAGALAALRGSQPEFRPPRWLRNPHAQTLVAARLRRSWSFGWREWEPMLIDLGKAGQLLAEASWQPGRDPGAPVLFLLHGLEGSARSPAVVGMSKKAYAAGFHTVRVNLRNCGGTEHLTPTLYCAALSEDVQAIVRHLRQQLGMKRVYGAGVSLGANILLKFLGEQGDRGGDSIQGAAVLSAPIELAPGARMMDEPRNWIYRRHFVGELVARMRRKTALFPDIGDMQRIGRIRTIWEFDDVVTAPHFGFGSAENYYRLASSGPLLRHIRVPTLIIQAMDDPLIPFEPFRTSRIEENSCVTLLASAHGGHNGFLASAPPGDGDWDRYWGECRAVRFLCRLEGRA